MDGNDGLALDVRGITKAFGRRTVVDDVSFHVRTGEVFGLLGPNGSGKTTTIRIALGILRANSGSVATLGGRPERALLKRVGYLPQERGLTKKMRVIEALRYLGRLKGMASKDAEQRALELLERVDLLEHRNQTIEGLSGGMAQFVQFISSILHSPELIILDEPFAGLDPLNAALMKELLVERRQEGATVVFSTHILPDVEELCERVALIADGKLLLFGDLAEIKRAHGRRGVRVQASGAPASLADEPSEAGPGGVVTYALEGERGPDDILRAYLEAGATPDLFERVLPSLTEIFVEEVSRARGVV